MMFFWLKNEFKNKMFYLKLKQRKLKKQMFKNR